MSEAGEYGPRLMAAHGQDPPELPLTDSESIPLPGLTKGYAIQARQSIRRVELARQGRRAQPQTPILLKPCYNFAAARLFWSSEELFPVAS